MRDYSWCLIALFFIYILRKEWPVQAALRDILGTELHTLFCMSIQNCWMYKCGEDFLKMYMHSTSLIVTKMYIHTYEKVFEGLTLSTELLLILLSNWFAILIDMFENYWIANFRDTLAHLSTYKIWRYIGKMPQCQSYCSILLLFTSTYPHIWYIFL